MSLHGKRTGNPTASANRSARRRDREARGASVRALTLDQLWVRDNGRCYRCKLPVPRSKATKDHKIPLSKGGRDTPSNSKLACRSCNSTKKDKTPKQLRKEGARKGMKRCSFRRKPKPLFERAAKARERAYDHTADTTTVYADEIPEGDLF